MTPEKAIKHLKFYVESSPVGPGRVLIVELDGGFGRYRSAVPLNSEGVTKKNLAGCFYKLAELMERTS